MSRLRKGTMTLPYSNVVFCDTYMDVNGNKCMRLRFIDNLSSQFFSMQIDSNLHPFTKSYFSNVKADHILKATKAQQVLISNEICQDLIFNGTEMQKLRVRFTNNVNIQCVHSLVYSGIEERYVKVYRDAHFDYEESELSILFHGADRIEMFNDVLKSTVASAVKFYIETSVGKETLSRDEFKRIVLS